MSAQAVPSNSPFSNIPSHWQHFLAFDYGARRIGVAVGNRITQTAQPLATLQANGDARWPLIERCIHDWQPDALVVGLPLHPDGAAHEMTAQAKKFSRQLQGRFHKPVFEVDERYSSVEAQGAGASDIDSAAACIILEQFLRSLP
jgi:putative holliday junction resolvase